MPDCNGASSVFDGIAYLPELPDSRDICLLQADGKEGIYVAELDLDQLRRYRESEVHGNAYRRPDKYGLLTDVKVEKPFIRKRRKGDMNIKESINATRKGFEDSFSSGEFYNKQTQDARHLAQILAFLPIKQDMTILDLGAGSGYLSFPIAKENGSCKVVGLDIVNKALEVNRERANRENLNNLSFVSYDGIDFPFADGSFDMVISRYALHHFPDIEHSIGEVSRVLRKKGYFFVSDPCPNDCDSSRFVDEYMQLKKDTAYGFDELLKKHDQSIIDSYDLAVTDTEIYVTERVNNILFLK